MSDKKVIGILGGMGPLATADLFQKITLHTTASCDQDHPRVCIDSNTNISDRTAALLHGGADPVPEMVKSAQRLFVDFLFGPHARQPTVLDQIEDTFPREFAQRLESAGRTKTKIAKGQ